MLISASVCKFLPWNASSKIIFLLSTILFWEYVNLVSWYEIPQKGEFLYGSNKCTCTAIDCNYDSDIFTTVNSTHLTVGAPKSQNTQNCVRLPSFRKKKLFHLLNNSWHFNLNTFNFLVLFQVLHFLRVWQVDSALQSRCSAMSFLMS